MIKVSVIIPVYGVEKYIKRCAESLFQQTMNDIEFIFVDDCTPDHSIEILNEVIDKYKSRLEDENKYVRLVRMPSNSGLAAVRRAGIQIAKGEYIIHCDSDDWMHVDMCHAMYEKAVKEGADIVVCDYFQADESGNLMPYIGCINTTCELFLSDVICQRISWAVWNKMVKRTIYTDSFIYPAGAMGEDMVICLQMLLHSRILSYVNKPYYYYYVNINSITKKRTRDMVIKRFRQSVANASIILNICKQWNIYESFKNEIDSLLLNKKNLIRPLIGEWKYYNIWKETFPEINVSVFWNTKIKFSSKIKHILTYLRLYRRES